MIIIRSIGSNSSNRSKHFERLERFERNSPEAHPWIDAV